jgi:hypothetical protein
MLFGPRMPRVDDQQLTEVQLHALLVNSICRDPGLGQLLHFCTATTLDASTQGAEAGQPAATQEGPLLRLLRRVALWWYYRVMFDPLDQLLALSSSYELLFQLMSPHQQLSCMADILLLLACPLLGEKER